MDRLIVPSQGRGPDIWFRWSFSDPKSEEEARFAVMTPPPGSVHSPATELLVGERGVTATLSPWSPRRYRNTNGRTREFVFHLRFQQYQVALGDKFPHRRKSRPDSLRSACLQDWVDFLELQIVGSEPCHIWFMSELGVGPVKPPHLSGNQSWLAVYDWVSECLDANYRKPAWRSGGYSYFEPTIQGQK